MLHQPSCCCYVLQWSNAWPGSCRYCYWETTSWNAIWRAPGTRQVQTASSELSLATIFKHQSDRRRHGKLSEERENSFTQGNEDHPKDLVSAYHLINEYKSWQPWGAIPDATGVAFAQKSGVRLIQLKRMMHGKKMQPVTTAGKKGTIARTVPSSEAKKRMTMTLRPRRHRT